MMLRVFIFSAFETKSTLPIDNHKPTFLQKQQMF